MHKNFFFFCFACLATLGCSGRTNVVDYNTNYYTYFTDKCYYKNPTAFAERMQKPPFDKMKKMEIVTLDLDIRDTVLDNNNGEKGFLEKITLTQKDIDTVSQVLNYMTESTQIRKLPLGLKKIRLGHTDCRLLHTTPRFAFL